MQKLEKEEQSARENGWLIAGEIEESLGVKIEEI